MEFVLKGCFDLESEFLEAFFDSFNKRILKDFETSAYSERMLLFNFECFKNVSSHKDNPFKS
jgi:hypothetical protein